MERTEQFQHVDRLILQHQPHLEAKTFLTNTVPHHSPPREQEDINNTTHWNPNLLTLNFGTVGPSSGPSPWVLERKHHWDLDDWLPSTGVHALHQAQVLRLVLSEEFLFDTIDPNSNKFDDYTTAIYQHSSLTPWDDIFATLRSHMKTLNKQLDLIEIHVLGLGSMSSMSDYGLGEEQNSTAVLRPTERVYTGFIDEFTKFLPGTVREVRLGGLFPGDWARLIEMRMGRNVQKDLSEFVKEVRWWSTTDDSGIAGGVDLSELGVLGSDYLFETILRRKHAEARWAMLNGAGNGYDECDSDPGYDSDDCP